MSDTEGVYKVLLGFVTIGPTLRAAEKTQKNNNTAIKTGLDKWYNFVFSRTILVLHS